MHSYQCVLANHILAALVGCLEVPGGHRGGSWPGEFAMDKCIVPGPDGMKDIESHEFIWPPISYNAIETLVPYSKNYDAVMTHLTLLHIVDPPRGLPLPPPPMTYINYRSNPMTGIGEPEIVAEALKKIPFIVSIAYVENEVTQFADIVLPEHTELERYQLHNRQKKAVGKKFYNIAMLRQPVIKPVHNTMDIADIFTELANRIGFLDEYNKAANDYFRLINPYKLESGNKYDWVDIVDRHCQSLTNGDHDLQWFRENSAILRLGTVEEQYDVHLGMKANKLRYPIPYMEHVKKTGEKLARNLDKVGIDWWPTSEYVALPIYVPPILEEVPPEYDFYVTTCRCMQFQLGTNIDIPWLIEIAEHVRGQTRILMNATAARARGIENEDEIWVESEVGRMKGKVKLTQGIRPDTLSVSGMFGRWATPIAKDTGWVSATQLTPIRHIWTDPVIGIMQGVVKAKIYKA